MVTRGAPAMAGGRRNSGSVPPISPVACSRLRMRRRKILWKLGRTGSVWNCGHYGLKGGSTYIGSQEIAMIMPTAIPRKLNPTCQRLKPWLFEKTRSKAPKKRYTTPSSKAV
jgi:hypothetical protein